MLGPGGYVPELYARGPYVDLVGAVVMGSTPMYLEDRDHCEKDVLMSSFEYVGVQIVIGSR